VALWHSVDEADRLDSEEMMAAYSQLKKDGKLRHVGFSTHNAAATLPKALATDFWEVVLLIYNHMEGPKIEPLLRKVRDKGIGTIAMKVFAGNQQGNLQSLVNEKMNYSQAAIRWTLGNPAIDCCIVTMSTFSHVEEYVAASGKPLVRDDLKVISRYQHEAGPTYCRVSCRDCLQACPYGVAVNDVLRYAMYYEHYGMQKDAMRYYADLEERQRPVRCADCHAPCQAACPHRLQVKDRLLRSREFLSC
jgi:predicted aldo/keto reductase-like oxidoreductase